MNCKLLRQLRLDRGRGGDAGELDVHEAHPMEEVPEGIPGTYNSLRTLTAA